VPAYFDPGSGWIRLEHSTPAVRLVVMNPDSGPGGSLDPGYVSAVRAAQAAGITVVGYVYTDYGARSLDVVESDVAAYYRWYGVNGIFFDEASDSCSKEPYYATLDAYVHAEGAAQTTILNPGTATGQCYLAAADILLTFEGSYHQYVHSYSAPAWVARYPSSRFWHVIYDAPNAKALARTVKLGRQRGAGLVYVTSQRLPNPYGELPALVYWHDELDDAGAG
jgi:hypothetical protein